MSLQRLRWWKTPTLFALTGCSSSAYRLIRPSSSHRHTVLIARSMSPYPWSLFGYFALTRSLKIALFMDQSEQFKPGAAASAQKRTLMSCSPLHSQVLHIASGGQQGPFWVFIVFPHISIPQTAEQELLMLAFQDGDHGNRVLFWIRGFPYMTKINNSEKDQNQDVLVLVSQSLAEWKEVWNGLYLFFVSRISTQNIKSNASGIILMKPNHGLGNWQVSWKQRLLLWSGL